MNDIVIVVTGAAPLCGRALSEIPVGAVVFAADGALDHALAAGLTPTALIGDLDSVSTDGLEWATSNATVDRHPRDKDHTDTELALAGAVDLDPRRLLMVSGGGDRLDHTFAAIGALGAPSLTSISVIDAWWGDHRLAVLHGPGRRRLEPPIGTTISLLALHGTCTGVSIDGVRWPLDHADLDPTVGLGVSNRTTADDVEISLTAGVLTVFIDDRRTDDLTDRPTDTEAT
jgi:thiamine pyrophosphokinase